MIEGPARLDCSADTGVDAIGRDPAGGPRVVVKHRSRLERAQQRAAANARLARGQPQRHVAADLGVTRCTLQDWCQPTPVGAAPAMLAALVTPPEGVQWLHQIVVAAHVVITLQGGAGVRLVCQFLELSGLSAFVGASYGTSHADRIPSVDLSDHSSGQCDDPSPIVTERLGTIPYRRQPLRARLYGRAAQEDRRRSVLAQVFHYGSRRRLSVYRLIGG